MFSKISCKGCSIDFMGKINIKRKYTPMFCNIKCYNSYQKRTNLSVGCKFCNKLVTRRLSQVEKSGNIFCNRSCSAFYRNAHKTTGIRISKFEKYLHEKLPIVYPNLLFIFNGRSTINSELDVYIPKLNLAVELNGIVHYEPIYGQEKLDQIKNNDCRKFQACLEKSIELIIIDTSNIKYFKEDRVKKYLDIITDIIDAKLISGN